MELEQQMRYDNEITLCSSTKDYPTHAEIRLGGILSNLTLLQKKLQRVAERQFSRNHRF